MLALAVMLSGLGALAYLSLSGRAVELPAWASDQIATRIGRALGEGDVRLTSVELRVDRRGMANIVLKNISVRDARGADIGQVNEIAARFSPVTLMQSRNAVPARFEIAGAQVTIRRSAGGDFQMSMGGSGIASGRSLADVLDIIDRLFTDTALAGVSQIDANDVTITLEDARSGRVWQVTNGRLRLRNTDERIEIDVFSEVFNGTEDLATVQLSFGSSKGTSNAEVSALFENAAAADIALQSPVLSYLSVIDAPVSGAIRGVFDDQATLASLAATLDIGAGALRPEDTDRPVPFNEGRIYLTYDPVQARITFTEAFVESDRLRLVADGHAFLDDWLEGWPQTLAAQLNISEVAGSARGIFTQNVGFDRGVADVRLTLDPFTVDIGQAVLLDQDERIALGGQVLARADGWAADLDISANAITPDRLLSLWPVVAIPNTRKWLEENLLGGLLTRINASVRLQPDAQPLVGLSYDFEDARVRFLPHFPPITGGRGHAALTGTTYAMHLSGGNVKPLRGPAVDLAGSDLRIVKLYQPIERAEISLKAEGTLEAALSLMNNKPFEVLRKSGQTADVATAGASFAAGIGFDLTRVVLKDDVAFDAVGVLSQVTSQTLVPGRTVEADALDVSVTPAGLTITGPVRLDGFPVRVEAKQSFGQDGRAPVEVSADLTLSQDFLDTFGIALPPGSVSGAGPGHVDLTVPRDDPPDFRLVSDTRGLRLAVPALGWAKSPDAEGLLEAEGTLGPDPDVRRIALSAPGLEASGRVDLAEGGTFLSADFDRIQAGNWFDAPVRIESRGEGAAPAISIPGGRIDIRNVPGGAGGDPAPVSVALDQVRISDGLAATDVRAQLVTGAGLSGEFRAKVNGGADIWGRLDPVGGRTAVTVIGNDAGRTFREAGIFRFARDGTFEATLTPRASDSGYDGRLRVKNTRLTDQPVVMALLDAVSVVGILDQLRGAGVLFETVDATFRLFDDRLILDQSAAVGASIGISLDGVYDTRNEFIDMGGVISPVYLLNSVGSAFTRRGEGLFGFTFFVRGPADNPKVSVNPLSLLTPGMFREIFRRAPPSGGARLPSPEPSFPEEEERPRLGGADNN